jgi:hypothetical protein
MTLDYTRTWEVMNELESVTSKICSAREILESALNALENHKYNKAEALMYAVDEYLQYYLKDFDEKFKTAWSETVVKLHKKDEELFDSVLREREYYEPSMPPWGHSDLEYLANDILTKDRMSNFPGEQYTDEELNAMCDKAEQDQITFCGKDNSSEECKESWGDFWNDSPSYYFNTSDNYITYGNYNEFGVLRGGDSEDVVIFGEPKTDKVKKWILPVQEMENGDSMEQEYFIQLPDDLLEQVNWKENDELNWEDNGDGTFTLRKVNCVVF